MGKRAPRPAVPHPVEPTGHATFMRQALAQAVLALEADEVPVGALVVHEGRVVGQGYNRPVRSVDPTAHAEVIALRAAAHALGNYRLAGTTLYVTLEPCLMCVGAIVNARVSEVVYGASEPKWGAVTSVLAIEDVRTNHRFRVVSGVLEEECRGLVVDFFRFRRAGG